MKYVFQTRTSSGLYRNIECALYISQKKNRQYKHNNLITGDQKFDNIVDSVKAWLLSVQCKT